MKFHGKIGFWLGDVETSPGIWENRIEERAYTGEILRNGRRFQAVNDQQNDNLTITNKFSILSDLFLRENLDSVRYIVWNGAAWSVTSIDISYPRITLEIGGVYNGERPTTTPRDTL